MNGQIYVWKGNQLEEILPGVHSGSIFTISVLPDGFITSGKDGIIRTWDATFTPVETIDLRNLISEYDKSGNFQLDGKIFTNKKEIRNLSR